MSKFLKIKLALLSFTVVLSFLSCSEETNNPSSSYYFTAQHSGFSEGTFTAVNITAAETAGVITIFGYLGSIEQSTYIQLTIRNAQSQTVDLSNSEQGGAGFVIFQNNNYNIFTATTGSINISSKSSTEVEGTFNFTSINSLNETMNVTNGKFKAKIISQ